MTLLYQDSHLSGFTCSGHANRGKYGNDLVCSAVSAITQTCVLGFTEVLKLDPCVRIDDDGIDCRLSLKMDEAVQEKTTLLMQTMCAGLAAVEEAYPGTIQTIDREV